MALSPVDDEDSTTGDSDRRESVEKVIDTTNRDPLTGSLNSSERLKIMQLLERWEEPDRYFNHQNVSSIKVSLCCKISKKTEYLLACSGRGGNHFSGSPL
jgi:hypothetical protein